MEKILITGGTGTLGRKLVPGLLGAGYTVRLMSRGPRRASFPPEVEWVRAKLASGEGLGEGLREVDTVIHAATAPFAVARVDVEGTRKLLGAAAPLGVRHFLYISIVGVDAHPFGYYRAKFAAENLIREAGVPWTILRATQFHELLDKVFLPPLMRLPVAWVPTDFKFQVMDAGEAAARMLQLVQAGPSGLVADIGGPEVRTMGDLAQGWLRAHGMKKKVVHWKMPGGAARAFREGVNTCPAAKYGKITWEDYLAQNYDFSQ